MTDVDEALRSLAKSGIFIFAGTVIELLISFIGKIVLAQYLDLRNFGVVSLGLTVLTVLGAISLLGLNQGITRNYPRYSGKQAAGVIKSSFHLGIGTAIIVGTFVLLFAQPIAVGLFEEPRLVPVLQIYSIFIPIASLIRLSISATQAANQSLPKVVVRNLTMPISRLAFVGIAAIAGLHLLGTAFVYVLPMAIGGVLALFYAYRATPILKRVEWTPMYSKQFFFSAPLMISTSIGFIMGNTDTFLIGFYTTSVAVGVYNIAYTLSKQLTVFIASIGFLSEPLFSDMHSDGSIEEFHTVYQVMTKWVTLATLPVFFVVVLYPVTVISLTFGAKYADAAVPLQILAVGFLFSVSMGNAGGGLTAIGRTKTIMYGTFFAAVVNIVLGVALIPIYGIEGAAVATAIMQVVLNLSFVGVLYMDAGVHPISSHLLRPLVLVTPVIFGASLIIDPYSFKPFNLALFIVSFGLFYVFIIVVGGGIAQSDIMILRSIEEKYGVELSVLRATLIRFTR